MDLINKILPAGINKELIALPSPVKNIIFIKSSAADFTSHAAFISKSAWRLMIQEALTAYMPFGLQSAEPTTDDPTITTSAKGRKTVGQSAMPSMVAYFESNEFDFQEVQRAFTGGLYKIVFVLENGLLMGTKLNNYSGDIGGFKANVTAISKGVPPSEGGDKAFAVYINFTDKQEFLNVYVDQPVWDAERAFREYMPIGYDVTQLSAYVDVAGTFTVRVQERGGNVVAAGLTTISDWAVLDQSGGLTAPAVTTVAAVTGYSGDYTITLMDGASPLAPLNTGDWCIMQIKKMSGTVVTHISNRFTITND